MKKRKKVISNFSKKKVYIENTLDWKLNWGTKGLKISFSVLVLLIVFFLFVLLSLTGSLERSIDILLRPPFGQDDFFGIFAGSIMFIAIPFILGMYIGIKFRERR